jgi:Transcriptional regulator, AbiEi antitoxin
VSGERFAYRNKVRTPPGDRALAALAGRQHGVVTAAQLAGLGLGRHGIAHRVRVARLHRVRRGVYSVGHARLSRHGVWMAAVLAVGEGGVLSHLCAAVLWQAWRRAAPHLDVVTPRDRRVRGIRVHRCRNLDRRDVTTHQGVPVTTVARTLVDLTDVLTAAQLANVIHEAAFRHRFSLSATRAAMTRANGRPHLSVLERALELNALGSAGTKSDPEDRALALAREAGLPEPLPNVKVPAGGRHIEVDLYWPELALCAEVDGPGHERPRTRREDQSRDRALRAAGLEVVRFSARSPRGP